MKNRKELKVRFSEFCYLFAFIEIFKTKGFKQWLSSQGYSLESYFVEPNLYSSYIAMFKHFIYDFVIRNPEWKLNEYNAILENEIPEKILKENGGMEKMNFNELSSQCLMADLFSMQRADRWHGGNINSKWYKEKSIMKILTILERRCRKEDEDYKQILKWKRLKKTKKSGKR